MNSSEAQATREWTRFFQIATALLVLGFGAGSFLVLSGWDTPMVCIPHGPTYVTQGHQAIDTGCLPIGLPTFVGVVLAAGVGGTLFSLLRHRRGNIPFPAAVAVVGLILLALVAWSVLIGVFDYPNPRCALAPCGSRPITQWYWKGAAEPPY